MKMELVYASTRDAQERVTASQAILRGLANDGGDVYKRQTQKILAAHAGLPSVCAGQLIEADLDLVLGNDITSPVAIHEMDKMKVDGVFDKDKIALVLDHFCLLYTSRCV